MQLVSVSMTCNKSCSLNIQTKHMYKQGFGTEIPSPRYKRNDTKMLFQVFKCHDVIKCLSMKHETDFTEYLASLCNITKVNFFIKTIYEKCGRETSSMPFLIFKNFSVKRNLRKPVCWFVQILEVLLMHISYE